MAKVNKTSPTPSEAQNMNAYTRDAAESLAQELATGDFVKSLDLPTDVKRNAPTSEKLTIGGSEEAVDVSLQDEEEEKAEDKQPDVEEDELSVEESLADEDEDLVPQSKVNKRISRLQARIRALEAEKAAQAEDEASGKDPDQIKLDGMNEGELKNLRRQVRKELRHTDDTGVEQKLEDLYDKIDDTLQKGPQRFQQKQIRAFTVAAKQLAEENSLDEQQFGKIREIAEAVYKKSKSMQSRVEGQAEALNLAFDHYSEISTLSDGKSGDKSSKREMNKLKKKLSLDSKVTKGDMPQSNLRKLRDRAKKSGSELSQLEYARKSGILGDVEAMVDRQIKGR